MHRREAIGVIGAGAVAAVLARTAVSARSTDAAPAGGALGPETAPPRYGGVYLFAMTPMQMRGGRAEVDYEGFAGNMRFYVRQPGTFSIAVIGAVGEYHVLTPEERREMIRIAAAEKGNRLLVAGAGGDTTRELVASAQLAQEAGAEAAVLLPSADVGKMGDAALLAHFHEIARSVDIAVIPYRSPILLFDLDTVARLQERPNIVALKEQTGDLRFVRDAVMRTQGRLPVVPAHERLAPFNHLAGAGGITSGHANFTPRRSVELWQWLDEGRTEEAMVLADQFAELDRLRATYGDVLLKAGLELRGQAGGPLRQDPRPLPAEGRRALERVLREMGELEQATS
jgi:dihydrodipicolinate synthase/N-acetylneuraminate lyase